MTAPVRGLGRRLARDARLAVTGRLAAVLAWLFLTPPILAALGPAGFAAWALFFALTGYFAALDLGIVQGTLRHVAAERARGDHAAAGAHATLGLLGFTLLGVLWGALALLLRAPAAQALRLDEAAMIGAGAVLPVAAVVFVAAGCANVGMVTLQGCGRFDLANRVSLLVTALQAGGCLLALRTGAGLPGLMVAVGSGWAVGALAAALVLRFAVPGFRWGGLAAARARLREALDFGLPMQLASALAALHAQLDKFLLPSLVALQAVTPYELGARVPGSLQAFPQMLLLALMPAAASLHATGDRARLRELHDRGQRYLLAVIVLIAAALLGPAERLLLVWVGPGQGDAVLALRGLTLATAFLLASGPATVVVRALGRTRIEAGYAALSFALHLGLSLWALPRHGLAGGVAAALIANVVALPCYLAWTARAVGWRFREVALAPHVRPALALVAGTVAAGALDQVLPSATGAAGWGWLALECAVAVTATGAVLLASQQLDAREVMGLVRGGGA